MKQKILKLLIVTLSLICLSAISAYSQTLRLQSYTMDIYPCVHPEKGFIKTDFSIQHESNSIDSFIINYSSQQFTWKDSKGSSTNKMYKISRTSSETKFQTEYNTVKTTKKATGEYIMNIIFLGNDNEWYMLEYQCKTI